MLVPPDSQLGGSKLLFHINKFCNDRVVYRYVFKFQCFRLFLAVGFLGFRI